MLETMPFYLVTTAILIFILIFLLYFYLKERAKNENQTLTIPQAQKSWGILHFAIQKAQEIIGNAELESVKTVADSKFEVRKLEERYQKNLDQLNASLQANMQSQMQKAMDEYTGYLQDLKVSNQQVQLLSQEFTQQKVNEVFERFEQNLSGFLTTTEQKSITAIELELKAAKGLIETYKAQQMALVDENIVSILERTLSLILAKKMSLKDNMDLVYEALEKAKQEKFIS